MSTSLINLRSSVPDTQTSAGLVDKRVMSASGEADTYILRGIEVGPGLKINVVDFDSDTFKTTETKIVLELDGNVLGGPSIPSILNFVGKNGILISGSPIIGSGTVHIGAQTASSIRPGMMTSGDKIKLDSISGDNTGDQHIIVVGDVTGQGGPSNGTPTLVRLYLGETGVDAGTYRNPVLTVNEKGLITEITGGVDPEPGETNVGENIGPGYGLFARKQDVRLQFKSLLPGTGVDIQEFTDHLIISAASGGVDTGPCGATYSGITREFVAPQCSVRIPPDHQILVYGRYSILGKLVNYGKLIVI